MFKIYDGREHFYQWDLDRKLIIEDPTVTQVHFCNRTDDCSLVCETYVEDGLTVVNVPNILLQSDWKIHVYAYDGKHTKFSINYDVVSRTKPSDYAYTETEILNWSKIDTKITEAIEDATQAANDANSAASEAIEAKNAASEAAINAENAAAAANYAVGEANTASGHAKAAGDYASEMGTRAFEATEGVNAATEMAISEANKASVAASNANNAAGRVDTSIKRAEQAANDANNAASSAIGAASSANSAADRANIAADNANMAVNTMPLFYANALKGNVRGETIDITDISPVEHELEVVAKSKNIIPYPYFNTTKTTVGITFTDNGDGSITINGTAGASTATFYLTNSNSSSNISDLFEDGKTYRISSPGSATFVLYCKTLADNKDVYYYQGNSFTVDKSKYKYIHMRIQLKNTTIDNLVYYPLIHEGTTAEEYTPYVPDLTAVSLYKSGEGIEPITYSVAEDGMVEGVTSLYPHTTLYTDTTGVVLECEYNKDINKAFAELQQAIISLGGNV